MLDLLVVALLDASADGPGKRHAVDKILIHFNTAFDRARRPAGHREPTEPMLSAASIGANQAANASGLGAGSMSAAPRTARMSLVDVRMVSNCGLTPS